MTSDTHKIFPFLFMLLLSLTPLIAVESPRSLCFLPVLTGVLMSIWWRFGVKGTLHFSKAYIICVLGLCGMCFVSALWSINPTGTIEEAAKASAILLFSIPAIAAARSVPISIFRPYFWLFPVFVAMAAVLSAYELANGMPLFNYIRGNVGDDIEDSTHVMNRGVVCISFSYFLALVFIAKAQMDKLTGAILIALMSVGVCAMMVFTQSQSGQVAFIIAALVALIFPARHSFSYGALHALISVCMIITPMIVYILYSLLILDGQDIAWLKEAYAGNRVEVWEFVMKYALQNPIYGHGMEATRFVEHFDLVQLYHKDVTVLHPHNFSIQVWMEFGIIGVFMALGFFGVLLKGLWSVKDIRDRRIFTGLFISVMLVAAVGYGMWQGWWIGLMIYILLVAHLLSIKSDTTLSSNK